MPLSKAMSGDLAVNVPVTVTLPADAKPPHEKGLMHGTFWGTGEDLRAAVRGGAVDTTRLKRGLLWFRPALNVGYDARAGEFIPEVRDEDLAKQAGLTNLKVA